MNSSSQFHRWALTIDIIASSLLGLITAMIFISAVFRYLFTTPIPDSFDISRLLLGVCILWGLASVSYRGGHISVDILWTLLPQKAQRAMDIFATLVTLLFILLFAWMLMQKVGSIYASYEETFDLRIQVWPFYALAWGGVVASVAATCARLYFLFHGISPEDQHWQDDTLDSEGV